MTQDDLLRKAREMRHAIDMIEGAMMRFGELTELPRTWGEPRHRRELGVTLKTNCGQVYDLCDALSECTRIINSDEYVFRDADGESEHKT